MKASLPQYQLDESLFPGKTQQQYVNLGKLDMLLYILADGRHYSAAVRGRLPSLKTAPAPATNPI